MRFDTKIYTERLLLRPFTEDDIEPSYQIEQDPEVNRYTNDGGVKTLEQVTDAIQQGPLRDYRVHGYGRFAVELKDNPGFIGFSGLKYIEEWDRVDLGYRFARQHWGKGYATESAIASVQFGFDELNLEEFIATILPENIGSINVVSKLGFQLEKTIHEYGEDQLLYVLSKSDWMVQSKQS